MRKQNATEVDFSTSVVFCVVGVEGKSHWANAPCASRYIRLWRKCPRPTPDEQARRSTGGATELAPVLSHRGESLRCHFDKKAIGRCPMAFLVEVAGLELAASSTRNWRATTCATPRYRDIISHPWVFVKWAISFFWKTHAGGGFPSPRKIHTSAVAGQALVTPGVSFLDF